MGSIIFHTDKGRQVEIGSNINCERERADIKKLLQDATSELDFSRVIAQICFAYGVSTDKEAKVQEIKITNDHFITRVFHSPKLKLAIAVSWNSDPNGYEPAPIPLPKKAPKKKTWRF